MPYGIEVLIRYAEPEVPPKWVRLRPTRGHPYVWVTKAEAAEMRRICYPDETPDEVRIVEVTA